MIELKKIYEIMDSESFHLETERISLYEAKGRILAHPVLSPLDSPPFDKSAMDGWALVKDEVKKGLKIINTVGAGESSSIALEAGTTMALMTGAPIPDNCDRIIPFEEADRQGMRVFVDLKGKNKNIIYKGENLRKGEVVLERSVLGAKEIGVLASLGLDTIEVVLPPRVGIISTGTELKQPGETLGQGQIYDSNGPQLISQSAIWGIKPRFYGITTDSRERLGVIIKKALEENDILLLSGGVSRGDFDYIPSILDEAGVEKVFHRAAIKPGRPLWYGKNQNCRVFGLPGNPVAVFMTFEFIVKRLIRVLCGLKGERQSFKAPAHSDILRSKTERTDFVPVTFCDREILPTLYKGSSHLNALSEAQAVVIIEKGSPGCRKGEMLDYYLLG